MGHRWMDIFSRRELVWILIERNLKIRYKSSFLGFFWSLLAPLSLIVVYSVFLGLIRFPMSLPVLVTSIIIWQFLAMCMGDALQSILGNANLVTKAAFPRVILPLSMVGANAINFLFSFAVLSVYLLIARVEFGALIYLPGIMLTQAALCLGMSLIIGTANVFFRDTEHVLSVVMLAWFFLTPVFYPVARQIEFLAAHPVAPWLVYLNPMTGILGAYRAFFLGQAPAAGGFAISAAVAVGLLAAGLALFQSSEGRFGDVL